MYKIEEFEGSYKELEKFINEKHMSLVQIITQSRSKTVSPGISINSPYYLIVFLSKG